MSGIRKMAKALGALEVVEPFTNMGPRGRRTRAGVSVSSGRAMRHAAVWACIRNRAEDIAKMPVRAVEYQGRTRIRHELPPWLQAPNPETTAFELFERTTASMDADGNGFWHVSRDRLGRVGEVWVLPPSQVQVWRDAPVKGQAGVPSKMFTYGNEDYTTREIVHFSGFSLPGRLRGLNPIQQHMHTIGLSIAAEEYGESFFGNGATMSGVVSVPGVLEKEVAERMQADLAQDHQGLENAHRPGILYGGATWTQLSIPNDAAQFLETRNYQLRDISRIWRMPLHKIGDLERATFSNIEHQSIEYVTDGLLPPMSRIESTVFAHGLMPAGQHMKFNPGVLLKGDAKTRFEAYAQAIQWGWMCPDDVRELEDLDPLPDGIGSVFLRPLNMTPASATDESEVDPKMIEALGALISAGFSPDAATAALGLPPITHTGNLPVTVQAEPAPRTAEVPA